MSVSVETLEFGTSSMEPSTSPEAMSPEKRRSFGELVIKGLNHATKWSADHLSLLPSEPLVKYGGHGGPSDSKEK